MTKEQAALRVLFGLIDSYSGGIGGVSELLDEEFRVLGLKKPPVVYDPFGSRMGPFTGDIAREVFLALDCPGTGPEQD